MQRAHAYLSLAALAAQQRVARLELALAPAVARVLRLALRARRAGLSLRATRIVVKQKPLSSGESGCW
jgi:hypothetical protein